MKTPHLLSAVAALGLAFVLVIGFVVYAQQVEDRYVHAVAPLWWQQKSLGSALQKTAFRQSDLLPIYGSSELNMGGWNTGRDLLKKYPTGFIIFSIGSRDIGPLNMALALAATDAAAQNKKLVISLSPGYFITDTPNYPSGFSNLIANELAFSVRLSYGLKQAIARRMLRYPETLANDPILRFALQQLAIDSLTGRTLYYGSFPLGRLHLWVLHLQDHWEVLAYIRAHPELSPAIDQQTAKLDWPSIIAQQAKKAQAQATNNPFGFENGAWLRHSDVTLNEKGDLPDPILHEKLAQSETWTDLDLLLRELAELGAHPLLISAPLKGSFLDYRGNSQTARALYYAKIQAYASRYWLPVVTFEKYEYDPYFVADAFDHLSKVGWAYYDQTLDAFYHDALP
jgi:D-alanine transfer protein